MSADFIHRYEVGKAPLKCMDMNFKGTIGVAGAENGGYLCKGLVNLVMSRVRICTGFEARQCHFENVG